MKNKPHIDCEGHIELETIESDNIQNLYMKFP